MQHKISYKKCYIMEKSLMISLFVNDENISAGIENI